MTRQEAVARLTHGVRADVQDYQRLQALLEEQFAAALRHHATRLTELAESIATLVDGLEQRRRERVMLAGALLGTDKPAMPALFARLPDGPRAPLEAAWHQLEQLVRDCKTLNQRNCNLMVEQHALMQRVLHGEGDTYAPA